MDFLIAIISLLFSILFWLVIIAVVLSYFLDPYHPVRRRIDSIVEPMLAPIRRVVPPIGMIDFSPFVLLILIQVLRNIIIRLLFALR